MRMRQKCTPIDRLVDELEGTLYLLLEDFQCVHGSAGFDSLMLVARCLSPIVDGIYLADDGHDSYEPPPNDEFQLKTKRIQAAIDIATAAQKDFVLCYHIDGDPLWRFVYSGCSENEAVSQAIKFLGGGFMLGDFLEPEDEDCECVEE